MEPFVQHTGLVAPLNRTNVDTDQIIPKQFLKRIERTGFGEFLFFDWRYHLDGSLRSDFVLNQPRFKDASVLLAGANFGCGSSREHAPWALLDYGFRVIIAPSFADIFFNNCFKNGILPIRMSEDRVAQLFDQVSANPGFQLSIDLKAIEISGEGGLRIPFEVDPFRRECLLKGLDDIGLTMQLESRIREFEERRRTFS